MIRLAVKNINSTDKIKKPAKKKALLAFFVALTVVIVAAISMANFIKAKEYDNLSSQVSEECESVKAVAEKESEIINGKGFDEYCEEIAREQYGYAKPGEYVLYDSSYGN